MWLAEMHELREDFAAARKAWEEIEAIQVRLRGDQHWQVTNARLVLAHLELLARLNRDSVRSFTRPDRSPVEHRHCTGNENLRRPFAWLARSRKPGKSCWAPAIRNTRRALKNLAELYQAIGENKQAEPLFRRRWRFKDKSSAKHTRSWAITINSLAGYYVALGMYGKAEALYRQSLEILKQSLGKRHPQYATTLDNLAGVSPIAGGISQGRGLAPPGTGDLPASVWGKAPRIRHLPQ